MDKEIKSIEVNEVRDLIKLRTYLEHHMHWLLGCAQAESKS